MASSDQGFGWRVTRSEAFAEDLDGLTASAPAPLQRATSAALDAAAQAWPGSMYPPPLIALLTIGLAVVPVLD